MFTYRCLYCGKQHSDPNPFAREFQRQCLRCARTFAVTQELIQEVDAPRVSLVWNHAVSCRPEELSAAIVTASDVQSNERKEHREHEDDGEEQFQSADRTASGTPGNRAKSKYPAEEEAEFSRQQEVPDLEDEEDIEESREVGAGTSVNTPAPSTISRNLLAGLTVLVLFASGLIGYYLLTPSPPAQQSLRQSSPLAQAPQDRSPPPPEVPPKAAGTTVDRKVKAIPPVEPSLRSPAFILSAPRLAVELASDPVETERKYQDTWLEVSGLLDKLETVNPAPLQTTFRAHFMTDRAPISGISSPGTSGNLDRWRALRRDQHVTLRGRYAKGGVLQQCLLLEPRAVADAIHAGKTVQLTGVVEMTRPPGQGSEFPTMVFERETHSTLAVHCLFQKAQEEEVARIPVGASVTIQGECAGRKLDRQQYFLRLDNCRLVATTPGSRSVTRLSVAEFTRAYSEDIQPFFLAAPGQEEKVETPLSLSQLSRQWQIDPRSLDPYRYRIVTILGRVATRSPVQLTLETSETNQPLKAQCRFSTGTLEHLADLSEVRISGLCMGIAAGQLRLDNCTFDATQRRKQEPVLTADFLPHKPGKMLTYDIVVHRATLAGGSMILRQEWAQREDGKTETRITHTARFTARSLFNGDDSENWVSGPKVKSSRKAGPTYVQKTSPLGIEFGQRRILPNGTHQDELEPVLKPGVKAGDVWEWSGPNGKHVYKLESLERWRGQPAAIVKEYVATRVNVKQERVTWHVYVQGLGEVERQEWLHLDGKEKLLVLEMKMILPEDHFVGPPREQKKAPIEPKR